MKNSRSIIPFLGLFTGIIFISSTNSFAQSDKSVLNSPDDWIEEIIEFPIGFAKEVDLKGFEELRFAPGWRDSTSENYFTYMFVWYVDKDSVLTANVLSQYFNDYYDGLMGVDHHNNLDSLKLDQLNNTFSLFIATDDSWIGKIKIYERFVKNDYIDINILVSQTYCSNNNQQFIRCEISPQNFNHDVWKQFDLIRIKPGVCE